MNENLNLDSMWKNSLVPRGKQNKNHNKTASKTTVSLYLNKILVKKARIHRLNLSKITEQALNSILDYLETRNLERSSEVLNPCSFQENGVDGAGFEPAASTMPTWRSYQADLPALSEPMLFWNVNYVCLRISS
jgi:post-segregation antitoxin (ccd killing protein)